jgi:putative redox protein
MLLDPVRRVPHPQIVPHAATKPTITVRAVWAGEHRFDTGRPDEPTARFDGSAKSGQNPVDALVSALAACTGIDVVDILGKRRTPPERLVVDAFAERRAEHPRRVERVRLTFIVDGGGISIDHTERAVALALTKYCSVAASLAPAVVIETSVVVNGASGEVVTQPGANWSTTSESTAI